MSRDTSTTADLHDQIAALERKVHRQQEQLAALRRKAGPEIVVDFVFKGRNDANVPLSTLFGAKDDLIVIHNMGRKCPYCTMWADGFDGILR